MKYLILKPEQFQEGYQVWDPAHPEVILYKPYKLVRKTEEGNYVVIDPQSELEEEKNARP